MAIPTYDELMVPVLKVLSDGSEHSGDDITNIIADQLNLTEEERNRIYPNNPKKIFKDRVAWARTYLKKAGLIESPQRSTSKITKKGMKVVKSKLKDLNLKFLEQYESYREFRHIEVSENSVSEKTTVETVQTPDEMLDYVRNSYKENLQSDLLTKLKKIDPIRFEQVVLALMEKMNYGVGSMTKMSHDGGIDGIIDEDELGLEKFIFKQKDIRRIKLMKKKCKISQVL